MIDTFKKNIDCPAQELTLLENEPMKNHTSFRIGGAADMFALPRTERAVDSVVRAAKAAGLPMTVLGNGSNVLAPDDGIRGVVLCLSDFSGVWTQESCIIAQSGALLSVLSRTALEHSLTGLEFAGGIPGSLGGALFMNAGAYDGQMANVVVSSRYYDRSTGLTGILTGPEHAFGYRTSIFKAHPEWIALSACLQLRDGDAQAIHEKMEDFAQRRREKQPLNFPSAGSTFKRPTGYFAGKLIQDAGLMGYAVGGAQVSEKHAGFVINRGDATCADVRAVIEHVQREVLRQFGVKLEPEVRML